MSALIICALIGGGIGAAFGRFRKCSTGACPWVANWRRGALSGALFGVAFYFLTGVGGSAAMNQSTANVERITEANFDAGVLHSSRPVVVDFYATWCVPCKILSPRLDQLAGSFTNKIKFVKINVDESPNLSQRFNIQGIPTLLFFKDGKVVDQVVGLPPTDDLKAHLEALAGTNPPPGGAQNQ
jgi:thioredoxin